MDKLRVARKQVAVAIIRQAQKEGVATEKLPGDMGAHLEARMWRPEFLPLRKARGG
ncbi:MAG: hypothetical protein ACJ8AT_27645 [Hyalangium sp.]|uniref:hypothetical protein n=1 Tax=Hyalangium sp. TaxID=2028555 RepID=UPI00389A763F